MVLVVMGIENMLYGLFDGFDYSKKIVEHKDIKTYQRSE